MDSLLYRLLYVNRSIQHSKQYTISDGNSGMYAVFSTDNEHVQPGTKLEMTSQWIPPNMNICLTFWYNMPTDKAFLEVYKRQSSQTSPDELLWKHSFLPTKGWTEANIMVHSNDTFQVILHFSPIRNSITFVSVS